MTTTSSWFSALVGAFCLLQLSSLAAAQTPPASATPATTTAAPPPPTPANAAPATRDRTFAAEDPAPGRPEEETEEPTEMKFGRGAPAAPGAASPAVPEPGPEGTRAPRRARTMEDVAESSVGELSIRSTRWRYSLNFFGDISLSAGSPADVDHKLGFSLGAQDVLIRGELNNNIVASTELALEPSNEGVTVDVERFNVRWQSAGWFAEAGRTHTAFGYWNNAYHHGRWLQPTIARPRWVAFEDDGGILPVHWVGAGVGARLPMGDTTLNLMATVGNGRGRIVDDVRNAGDYQAMKAFHASAELVGIGRPELRIGVAGIFDRIQGWELRAPPLANVAIDELIGSAHVAYVNVPLLLIVETYAVAHLALGHQWTTYGGFALVGYAFGRVTPYLEVERIGSRGGADPFLTIADLGGTMGTASFDTIEGIGGVRLDITDWTAIKAEYRQTRARDQNTTVYEGVVNWSWGF